MQAGRVTVVVGVAQLRRRPELDGPFQPVEPVQLMAEVVRRASADAGDPALFEKADYLGTIPPLAWPYQDTPTRLAEILGTSPPLRHEPKPGGNSPLELLSHAVDAISRGEARVAVLAGSEAAAVWNGPCRPERQGPREKRRVQRCQERRRGCRERSSGSAG